MSSPIGKYLNYGISFFTFAERNSLSMVIKAKFVRRSCSIDDVIHVFINFNFENDLSQLAIENPSSLLKFEENCSFENKKHTKQ